MAAVGSATGDRTVAERLDHAPDLLALSAHPGLSRAAVVSVDGWRLLVANPVAHLSSVAQLSTFAEAVGWRSARSGGPPFAGTAAVGFLTDGMNASLLQLPSDQRPRSAPVPAVSFGVYDWAVAMAPDGGGWIVAAPERMPSLRAWIAAAPVTATVAEPAPRSATCGLSRAAHGEAVDTILSWISAGDLYQANLTFQVSVPWPHTPQDLARRLEAATPGAAHAALISGEETTVVSVSPETFLRIGGDDIVSRPIKGTRARGRDVAADEAAAAALRASDKDHAEHLMIVDLVRNDLGRVCETGSITVPAYAALEAHPTVWHLTSTVRGRLRPDASLADVVAATFPPGSVTGTPKRMAVARTRRLEPVQRGVYCGAIGIVTAGVVDFSVAIRTAVVTGATASYGTGGGIVADSERDAEHEEAMAKAAAFLAATNATVARGREETHAADR